MVVGAEKNGGEHLLIYAPNGRDGRVVASVLKEMGLDFVIAPDLSSFIDSLSHATAAIVTEEALLTEDRGALAAWVARQPLWSDFPFILLTLRGETASRGEQLVDMLGNVTLLERPLRAVTIVSSARTAVRARRRQLQALAYLEECTRVEAALRELAATLEDRVGERTQQLSAANDRLTAEIAERERAESFLLQSRKIEAIGQLTGGVAHDFNNLLTVVLGNVTLLERNLSPAGNEMLARRLSQMRIAAERGAKLTAQLLAFSRRQRLEPKAVDLNQTIANMREMLQSSIGATTRIEARPQLGLWRALVDPTQIELVLINLAINARDAMDSGGCVVVKTENVTVAAPERPEDPPAGDYVMVSVTDSGTGMTDDVLTKAFEPFFTTKAVGKGSGLGLSQVLGFAKQSGGGVRIETRPGRGTSVRVYLPRASHDAAEIVPESSANIVPPGHKATVLLVDDDSGVREVTAEMLRELGYGVLEAGSGGAALDMLRREPCIELALIDYAMPEMNGAEVARRARAIRPQMPVLFITGYAEGSGLTGVSEERVIRKPFANGEISRKLRAALPEKEARGSRIASAGRS